MELMGPSGMKVGIRRRQRNDVIETDESEIVSPMASHQLFSDLLYYADYMMYTNQAEKIILLIEIQFIRCNVLETRDFWYMLAPGSSPFRKEITSRET